MKELKWNTETEMEQLNRIILDANVNIAIQEVRATLIENPKVAKTFERLLVYFSRENSALSLEARRFENIYHAVLKATADIMRRVDEQEAAWKTRLEDSEREKRQLRAIPASFATTATTTPEVKDEA